MITSLRDIRPLVAARRRRSISLVDGSLFLDVDVTLWNVRLRLIIIIIAYKVSHGVFRKEALKLAVKLGGQGFIVGHNQGGLPQCCNYVCHGKSLTRSRNP